MSTLRDVREWRRRLGYLPVPLFGVENESRFILLNGSKGNFCLETEFQIQDIDYRAFAWSSDVDHFVAITNDEALVFRWDKPGNPETVAIRSLESKLQSFQEYLESRTAPRERSVVAHAMRVFRALRARVRVEADGYRALLAFLGVLSRAWARQGRELGAAEWPDLRLTTDALSELLLPGDIDMLIDRLLKTSDGIKPDVNLIVRHASGRLFQEAHYLAYVNPQSDFFLESSATPIAPASRTLGAFFTPTPLVRTIVEQSLDVADLSNRNDIHLFDPACGSAEFLREAVRQLEVRGFPGRVRVTGFDISPAACAMARFLLAAESVKWNGRLVVEITNRDSLIGEPWPTDVSCCLMNPPFVSWRGMTPVQQIRVSEVLTSLREKRPDMASAFLYLAERCLRNDGVLGAVIPASMLDGESAHMLREHLNERLSMRLLARLGNQQVFADALVDPALVVARRRDRDAPGQESTTTLVWADHSPQSSERALRVLRRKHENDEGSVSNPQYSVYAIPEFATTARNWAPRPLKAMELLQQVGSLPTVGDFFSVQQGTITGMNSAFLLDHESWLSLPEREQRYFRPAVVNQSIDHGTLSEGTWVFYPYGEGIVAIRDEQHLAKQLKEYFKRWLKPNQTLLTKRARVKREEWWRLSEHRSWQIPVRRKIVSTYFGASGSFAWDATGKFIVVQGYGWVPKSTVELDDLRAYALIAILTSSITDRLLSAVSNNLSGGQWNLSKRFVERMPLPKLDTIPADTLEMLAGFGSKIAAGTTVDRRELDAHSWTIYGVDPDPED